MPRMRTTILIAALAALATTLTVGAHFGYTWAGGDGLPPTVAAKIVEQDGSEVTVSRNDLRRVDDFDVLRRGEIVHVNGGYARLAIGGIDIGLDANTDLELVSFASDRVEVRLLRGRMAIAGGTYARKLTVHAGPSETTYLRGGWVSITHFDFLGKVSIAPVGTAVSVIPQGEDAFVTQDAVDYTYWANPPSVVETSFDPKTGAAAAFYARFFEDVTLDETAEKP